MVTIFSNKSKPTFNKILVDIVENTCRAIIGIFPFDFFTFFYRYRPAKIISNKTRFTNCFYFPASWCSIDVHLVQ